MKAAICFLYIVSVVVYLIWGESTRIWFGFNIITQLIFTGVVCAFAASKFQCTENESLLFYYICFMSLGRAIYTSLCIFAPTEWILQNTDVFTFIVCITFGLFLIYLLTKKK